MNIAEEALSLPIYGLSNDDKSSRLGQLLIQLTKHHDESCHEYHSFLRASHFSGSCKTLSDIPFFPVRLFKELNLKSIPDERVYKALTSSGTSGQRVSKITLDKETAIAQTKALVQILQQFLGKDRLPMLVIDHPGVIRDRTSFSARGAGILGMSNFGRDHTYALNDGDFSLNVEVVVEFLKRHEGKKLFLFGFTFMIWKYFLGEIKHKKLDLDFSNAILIHGGGWKKLVDEAVDNQTFKSEFNRHLKITNIHSYYGMVEQVGSIFVECQHGRLHSPSFADVIVRNAFDWSIVPPGERGVLQVLSALPLSYPGHSLLTEDVGESFGYDNCPCGRLGQTFWVHGRVAAAEVRGCSDTHVSSQR